MAALPPPRVVTTTHNAQGTSKILSDQPYQPFHPFGTTKSGFTPLYSTTAVPAPLLSPPDALPVGGIPRHTPNGTLFVMTDFPPNFTVPIHRTQSLDYCVVLEGEVWMRLDGGEEVCLKKGDVIVQRGTMHEWQNRTDEWVRVLVVMVGGEEMKLENGEVLEQSKFGPPPAKK